MIFFFETASFPILESPILNNYKYITWEVQE